MAEEIIKECMKVLEPYLKAGDVKTIGKIVIETVRVTYMILERT
jgi:methanogenic corrinoid protein MtbC1